MGSKLTVQKRGRGGPAYRTPKHNFFSNAKYPNMKKEKARAEVLDFVQDPSKEVLLAKMFTEEHQIIYMLAAEGLKAGDVVEMGKTAELRVGNVCTLENIPDSLSVFNVELAPGDGGKACRTSGAFATVVSHDEDTGKVDVKLPSKKVISLGNKCRATIGVACGGGRTERPFKKAGTKYYHMKARNKRFPIVRGTKMIPADHPHGGRSFGKSSTVKRSAPPGQKVGHIAARRTGRRRGKAAGNVR